MSLLNRLSAALAAFALAAPLAGAAMAGDKEVPRQNTFGGSCVKCELSGRNLSGAKIIGANFSGAALVGANLREATFHGSVFSDADLSRADPSDSAPCEDRESRSAVALHFMHYNFCRVHGSLRVTPAMEARLTDHVWSLEELVGLLDRASAASAA